MATELRSKYAIKTPDAIHLASALVAGASSFMTGDKALAKIQLINIDHQH